MRYTLSTPEDTEALGARLARVRPAAGDALAVIYLSGDLGAGKTTFARGFLRACGVQEGVRSPTYTLVETYEAGGSRLLHLDLYRLRDPDELEALGVRDWAVPGHLWLIEWPERGVDRLPPADLSIDLRAGARAHEATVIALTSAGQAWLSRLTGVELPPR